MTRKDYEVIAKAIKGSLILSGKMEWQDHYVKQYRMTAERIADALERDNERFDKTRFMSACGIYPVSNDTEEV